MDGRRSSTTGTRFLSARHEYRAVAELLFGGRASKHTGARGGRSNSKPKYSIPLKLSGPAQRERDAYARAKFPLPPPPPPPVRGKRRVGGWENTTKLNGNYSTAPKVYSTSRPRPSRVVKIETIALFIPADFTANISSPLLAMHASARRVSMEQRRG